MKGIGNIFNPPQAPIEERTIIPNLGKYDQNRERNPMVLSGGFSGGMFGDIASPMSAYGF
jgi:hypothetical protein